MEIPVDGLDELPHNFFVQNLIEARAASIEQPMLCVVCEKDSEETDGNIPPATMYCMDCNQKLCRRCSRVHRAMTYPHQVKELTAELIVELEKKPQMQQQSANSRKSYLCTLPMT